MLPENDSVKPFYPLEIDKPPHAIPLVIRGSLRP